VACTHAIALRGFAHAKQPWIIVQIHCGAPAGHLTIALQKGVGDDARAHITSTHKIPYLKPSAVAKTHTTSTHKFSYKKSRVERRSCQGLQAMRVSRDEAS